MPSSLAALRMDFSFSIDSSILAPPSPKAGLPSHSIQNLKEGFNFFWEVMQKSMLTIFTYKSCFSANVIGTNIFMCCGKMLLLFNDLHYKPEMFMSVRKRKAREQPVRPTEEPAQKPAKEEPAEPQQINQASAEKPWFKFWPEGAPKPQATP